MYIPCSPIEHTRLGMPSNDAEPEVGSTHLALMRQLSDQPAASQRELSRRLGWSLGKTHYLVRALLEKGLVKSHNFRHSDNKIAYAYLLTPRGMKEKLRLTRSFLGRKEREYEALHSEIEALRTELNGTANEN